MTITIFIPSKNRAPQLRLLLQSIRDNLPTEEIKEIIVGYTHSDEAFKEGYAKLHREKILPITWVYEFTNPREMIDVMVCGAQTDYIMTLTDDSLVYKHVPTLKPAISLLAEHKNVLTFTLRLGFNTDVIDYTKGETHEYDLHSILTEHKCIDKSKRGHAEGVYSWNWKILRKSHFAHPISLDGTIMRMEDLRMLTLDAEHNSYRQWECCISDYVKRFDKNLHGCFEHSSLVTIPINQVVDAEKLTDGVHFPRSTSELNEQYLRGSVIDYHRLLRETEYDVDTPLKEFPLTQRYSRWYDWWLGK